MAGAGAEFATAKGIRRDDAATGVDAAPAGLVVARHERAHGNSREPVRLVLPTLGSPILAADGEPRPGEDRTVVPRGETAGVVECRDPGVAFLY
jgi:hypothetical protein